MVRAMNQLKYDDKDIQEMHETIENLEKLRDRQTKRAAEYADKVSINSRLIGVITVIVSASLISIMHIRILALVVIRTRPFCPCVTLVINA